MKQAIKFIRRALLPLLVFVLVAVLHYLWVGLFPERNPLQDRWVSAAPSPSWLERYIRSNSYWLGLSYAASITFAVVAFRTYRERRLCCARNLAIGGLTLSGFLAVVGCFLLGCCGSPMLAVYLSLFGPSFLPLAKPLVACLTLASILLGWWWMNRRIVTRLVGPPMENNCEGKDTCNNECRDSASRIHDL